MKIADTCILTINAGSSSIKFGLFEIRSARRGCSPEGPGPSGSVQDGWMQRILKGRIERIGLSDPAFTAQSVENADSFTRPVTARNHTMAASHLVDWIEERVRGDRLAGIGHRIVHGGAKYSEPTLVTPEVVEELRQLIPLNPEHLSKEIELAEACQRRFPRVPQIACFDTAFHHDLPRVARLLPIPRRYYAQGVRRYGFHGLSYAFLIDELSRVAGAAESQGRVILAHLGNGASLAAVRNGRPVDTTMGFTPASGLPMSTRSGDLDPGLVEYLARTDGLDAKQFNEMVNSQSGLVGVSETSSDVRDLLAREGDDVRAAEAIELFCYQVKKWIGAFAAALAGLDTLVFAGGIGENASVLRARICDGLGFLGLELAPGSNAANAGVISTESSRVTVRVMATDEETLIARNVCRVLGLHEAITEYRT